jgi:phosphatidylethanolamine-binding protein (PEBP) family uncharacterized protein
MIKQILNTFLLFLSLNSVGQEIELIIPGKFTHHTCEKSELSPALYWKHELKNIVSYLVIIESEHEVTGKDINFIAYNIPGKQKRIPSGIEKHKTFGGITKIGLNSNKQTNYYPPCNKDSKNSEKHVSLSIYALDKILTEKSGLDLRRIKKEIKDHILGKGTLYISL